jgi:hypothetical protein
MTRLYKFDNFGSSFFPSGFVSHSNDLNKLWHEWFVHLNYPLMQQLCNQQLVMSLPLVSSRDGVCASFVLGKHYQNSFDKCSYWHALAPLHLVHNTCFWNKGPPLPNNLTGKAYEGIHTLPPSRFELMIFHSH